MLSVHIDDFSIRFGERFSVSFQRTLRIPEDGRVYPLPPGFGGFPLLRVEDYAERLPPSWRERGGAFIPMYQREALWLAFDGTPWKPNAVKVGVGRVNAISGTPWDVTLRAAPQDYVVCPDQPWLDGINAGEGVIKQFVAVPLGHGYTVEAQVTGKEEYGGIQIVVFEPRRGVFPDTAEGSPGKAQSESLAPEVVQVTSAGAGEMGLAAGGIMKQKVYPDPYGLDVWDVEQRGSVYVHIVNTTQYRHITGLEPPPTPITAKTYTDLGLPWFELYDEAMSDVPAPDELTRVRSIGELDASKGEAAGDNSASLDVNTQQVQKLPPVPSSGENQ